MRWDRLLDRSEDGVATQFPNIGPGPLFVAAFPSYWWLGLACNCCFSQPASEA